MAELMRRVARQQAPGSPSEFRLFWYDNTLVLDRGRLGQLRRQLMSQGRRNQQVPRVARTLLDALWRQVRSERGRDRGRESFDDDLLGNDDFLDFVVGLVAAAGRPAACWAGCGDPELLGPRRRRACVSAEEQRLLLKSWAGRATSDLSIEDVAAARRAALRPRRRARPHRRRARRPARRDRGRASTCRS